MNRTDGSPAAKRCPRCGETKPLGEFHRNRSKPDGRCAMCRACDKARHDPATARKASRRYRDRHPEEVRQQRRRHYDANAETLRADARNRTRLRADQDRAAVFSHYGYACRCCGTTGQPSIDHVNGDGGRHRAEIGTGSAAMYRWLVRNGFPEGFQTMCLPCNQSKRGGDRCRLGHGQRKEEAPA